MAAFRVLELSRCDVSDVMYFGGVDFKYRGQIDEKEDVAQYKHKMSCLGKLASAGFMDAVCTSGSATGKAAGVVKIKTLRESTNGRSLLAIASGVTAENVSQYIGHTDFVLVATGISADFYTFDEQKMKELRHAIDAWSPQSI